MQHNIPVKYKKLSYFMKWFIGILSGTIIMVSIYLIMEGTGLAAKYQGSMNNKSVLIVTFLQISFFAIVYIALSLFFILNYKAHNDSRILCLPFIISPIFLILENGYLHLIHGAYYEMMMSIFTTTVMGVITFASLRFSFGMSVRNKRFTETAEVKPDINVKFFENNDKLKDSHINGEYRIKVNANDCYLCGILIGDINKIHYLDSKSTGTQMAIHDLYYPNKKFLYEKTKTNKYVNIRFNDITEKNIQNIISDAYSKGYKVFLIFRDLRNFYYFAQLTEKQEDYSVFGIDEYAMCRILNLYNTKMGKLADMRKRARKNSYNDIFYESMDLFKIPYNFYANENV